MDSCSDFGSNLTFVYHIFSNYVEHHRGKLACDDKSMNVEVPLEPGKYSVNVFLVKDHNEKNEYDPENMSILQAGSTTFTISDSTTVEVPMGNYEGGIFAKWPVEICSAFQTDTMKFSIKDGKGETVNSVIWGVETKLEQFPVNCSAGELRIMDIPEDSYDVKIEGFRKKGTATRIHYEKNGARVISNNEHLISLKEDQFSVVSSDLNVPWKFYEAPIVDSENPCSEAGVTELVALAKNDNRSVTSEIVSCDGFKGSITIFDIPEGSYTVTVTGMDGSGKAVYEGSLDEKPISIEKGHIGSDAYESEVVYIKGQQ